jgi:hypothetical protein
MAGGVEEGDMARRRRALRDFYEVQVRLWAGYGRRHELSGLETRAMLAPAPLHWAGGRLEGTVLPDETGSP